MLTIWFIASIVVLIGFDIYYVSSILESEEVKQILKDESK